MSRFLRRGLAGLGTAVVLVLSGCASSPPDLSPDAAARLQAAVLEVSESAAQGRYDAADRGVEQVRAVLVQAAEEGAVSAARYAQVEAALRQVEEELAAHRAAEADGVVGGTTATDGTAKGEATGTDEAAGTGTDEATGTQVDTSSREEPDDDGASRSEQPGPGGGPDEDRGKGPGDNPGRGPGDNPGRGPGGAPGPGRGGP